MKKQLGIFLCALWLTLAVAAPAKEECNKETCPGPIRFYEGMRCQPIYEKPGDCCAVRYECNHLKTRPTDKCYAVGREYAIGDPLRREDRRCNYFCKCNADRKGDAMWSCYPVHKGMPRLNRGCYFAWNASTCYPDTEICNRPTAEIPKCEVGGRIFYDGDEFKPKGEPWKECWCGPGYTGENVAPFCKDHRTVDCHFETRHDNQLRGGCIPVYEDDGSPVYDCNIHWRCPNPRDAVLEREKTSDLPEESEKSDGDEMTCQFGNLTMQFRDQLKEDTAFDSACVRCVCEAPPVPTCQFVVGCDKHAAQSKW